MARTKKAKADKEPAAKKTGRPHGYTEEKALEICELVADGQSINKISKLPGMPNRSTILKWFRDVPEFSTMYARAKEIGFEVLADEIIDLADAEVNTDKDQLRRHQLMIDTRKWLLAKLQPRKYGERVTQEIVGNKEEAPVQIEVTKEEIARIVQEVEDEV
ncbi:DNA-binding protein [Escherichia coli]|uniref:terminase small subunit-like protein n=1 Tax=Escherichia coli TaxID=562 RepID=UPI000BBB7465|nr:DNA-binding protein [Escherichia coli]EKF4266754.1 DNA-binding protein [Escherichia coli O113]EFF2795816.1 DNA-binding protein [Escherichia coli]EFF2922026.1 DNA-binding protein [Escherichia coli]EFF3114346.1 DNA-binding protein [Escherichia coli]EFF3128746.1 DNA-binding protein [Escherichia coli]